MLFRSILLEVWQARKRPELAREVGGVLPLLASLGYATQIINEACIAQVLGRPWLKLAPDLAKNSLSVEWKQS